ncbi:MAG TPA: tetratricopeptide repeat protein [Kiritimatiellia bacterium]|nr:tetratricopeptide repeat protein [Kiritimatiellia bacterium]HRZ11671.1 tetratricopeptide repeat protein [Kiritimatiellia bacterium]HSA16778.1 tetratricopeptide repeat protein [Kiritimatiellia bacterium]
MNRAAARWMEAFLLVLAVVLVYGNTLDHPFVLDDNHAIVNNPAIRRLRPLTAALNPPPADVSFCSRPLINLTMCVDYARGRTAPRPYRRTNLLLHAAATLALWGLARRTLRASSVDESAARLAGLGIALLWAVHPLNTAAVNYLTQRGELGVGLFLFLTLYGLNRAAAPGARSRSWLAASVLFCLLGMGSKECMAAAPVLAMAYDRIYLSPSWREVFRRRGPFYVALALTWAWPLWRILFYSQHIPSGGYDLAEHWHYLLTQAWGLARMVRLAAWPAPLVFYYGEPLVTSLADVWPQALFVAVLLGLTAWALLRRPRLGFPALCFFAILAPSSSFLPIPGQPIAEHRLYAPLAALLALAVPGLWFAGRRAGDRGARIATALALAWAVALGWAAHRRNAQYRDLLVLWQDTVAKRPDSDVSWATLASVLNDRNRHEEAARAFEQALRCEENNYIVHANLGVTLYTLGRYEDALHHLEESLRLHPSGAEGHHWRGLALSALGQREEALAAQQRALVLKPDYLPARFHLANELAGLGRSAEAADEFRRVIRQKPTALEGYGRLAALLLDLGRVDEAHALLAEGARASGAPARAYFEFSSALLAGGHEAEGLDMARRHLALEPDHPGSLNNAAWILATSTNAARRDGAEAVRLARRAAEQFPEPDAALWSTLAAAQAEAGQFPEAVVSAGRALEGALKQNDTNLAARCRARLETYARRQPWRE